MSFGAIVKSIQQGTGEVNHTAGSVSTVNVSISTVDTAKTEVKAWVANPGQWRDGVAQYLTPSQIAPHLSSATQLDLYIAGTTNAAVRYTWQIKEYY